MHRVTDAKRCSGTYSRPQSCLSRSSVRPWGTQQSLPEPQDGCALPSQGDTQDGEAILLSAQNGVSSWEIGEPHTPMPPTVSVLHHNRCFITEDLEVERETYPKHSAIRWQSRELRFPFFLFTAFLHILDSFIVVPWGLCCTFLGPWVRKSNPLSLLQQDPGVHERSVTFPLVSCSGVCIGNI